MPSYNLNLSQLHWRVWQEELGLSGTISAHGHIEFGRQGPGTLTIYLSTPGRAIINYRICDDYFDIGLTTESALALCNQVNVFSGCGAMLVDEAATIDANVHLFYLPLDDTGALPDEGFLRAWIGPTMTEIENVTKAFAAELKKAAQ